MIQQQSFGKSKDGAPVSIYTMSSANDAEVSITDYGGRIVSLKVPDRRGKAGDIVLGYDSLENYQNDPFYMGGIIGRYANRIARGEFSLDGKTYLLPVNNGENHNHGGNRCFDSVVWRAEAFTDFHGANLSLIYLSKDGEEGYPGNLNVNVLYTLTENNALKIQYSATSDQDTIINLTNHTYFNLAGEGMGTILNHQLQILGEGFTPISEASIPTGEIRKVNGTPFDFRTRTEIETRIKDGDEQLTFGNGFDHNFVLNQSDTSLKKAAEVFEPVSGRVLEVLTTEPGIHFYTGNYLHNIEGKSGHIYQRREGFCLETQHFPDSPNKPEFPSTILKKGEQYATTTLYKFSIV